MRRVAITVTKFVLTVPLIAAVSTAATAIVFLFFYLAQSAETYEDVRVRVECLDEAAGCGVLTVLFGSLAIIADKVRSFRQGAAVLRLEKERRIIGVASIFVGAGVTLFCIVMLTD